MSLPVRSIKFWINAFIPRDIPNYTKVVPKGVHKGKTMVPGPQRTPSVQGYRLSFSDCYLTDQRAFSNDIHAKSRIHSEFKLDFSTSQTRMTQWHNCDYTTECDCEDGDQECHKKGGVERCTFSLGSSKNSNVIKIEMECAASNPCAPTSRLFGDIDFKGKLIIKPSDLSIEFKIKIDAFPAFEAYATINDGAGVAMLQELPPPGNTVMNLPGSPNRNFRRRLIDKNKDGVFDMLLDI